MKSICKDKDENENSKCNGQSATNEDRKKHKKYF